MPLLFHYYFLCDFNKYLFIQTYEYFIRENAINEVVYLSNSTDTLVETIFEMIDDNVYTRLLNIHTDFPKDKLIEIMRPFVYLYYRYSYSLVSDTQASQIYDTLFIKLRVFYKFNPAFGRKNKQQILLFNINTNTLCPHNIISFNDTHILFREI